MILETDKISATMQLFLVSTLQQKHDALHGEFFAVGMNCRLVWLFLLQGLQLVFFNNPEHEFRRPRASAISDAEKKLVEFDPSGGAVIFDFRPDITQKYIWAVGPSTHKTFPVSLTHHRPLFAHFAVAVISLMTSKIRFPASHSPSHLTVSWKTRQKRSSIH